MIQIQSPTRVDLAGGTLDCWPLYALLGKCYTVNVAISIFTKVELNPRADETIELDIADLNYKKSFSNVRQFLESKDSQAQLVQLLADHFGVTKGFFIRTKSESPVGGGLGGSSSLCVSLIKSFLQMQSQKMNLQEIVQLAHNVEARMLGTLTGTQDYVPAAEPGLQVIEYSNLGFKNQKLSIDKTFFDSRMVVVYTGRSHHSGINNWQVIKSVIDKNPTVMAALKDLQGISLKVKQACEKQQWSELHQLFALETKAREQLSPGFTSPEIKRLQELCAKVPESSLKICGAGGGGCVMIWTGNKNRVIEECQKNEFQVLPVQVVV